jgi:hypothetical protein
VTKKQHLDRLRKRLEPPLSYTSDDLRRLRDILKGIIDLLEDEL